MNPAYLIGALASLFYGGGDFCGAVAARRQPALLVTFFSALGAIAVLLAGLSFTPGAIRAPDMAWGAAAGVAGTAGAFLIYRALAIGPVSVASPVLCLTGLALPVVVGLAVGERPSWTAIAGLLIAPLSIVLLARGEESAAPAGEVPLAAGAAAPSAAPRRVLVPALLAGFAAGLFLVCFGRVRAGAGLWPLLLARLIAAVLLGGALLARREPLVPARGSRQLSLAAGVLDSLANIAYVAAVQRGSLALVAALVSLAPATTVLLARALLRERWSAPQRVGFAVALLAGALISFG